MSESTRDTLYNNMTNIAETIQDYAEQIRTGEYGNQWQVTDEDGNSADVFASDEDDALYHGRLALRVGDNADLSAEHIPTDEPVADGGETPISEYPLEIVDQRGRELAVVLCTGGPHIEVVADGLSNAYLAGYWGGEKVTLSGDYFNTFLDYFIDRDGDN